MLVITFRCARPGSVSASRWSQWPRAPAEEHHPRDLGAWVAWSSLQGQAALRVWERMQTWTEEKNILEKINNNVKRIYRTLVWCIARSDLSPMPGYCIKPPAVHLHPDVPQATQAPAYWSSSALMQHQLLLLRIQLKKWHHHPCGPQSQKPASHPRLCPLPSPCPSPVPTLRTLSRGSASSPRFLSWGGLNLPPAQYLPLSFISTLFRVLLPHGNAGTFQVMLLLEILSGTHSFRIFCSVLFCFVLLSSGSRGFIGVGYRVGEARANVDTAHSRPPPEPALPESDLSGPLQRGIPFLFVFVGIYLTCNFVWINGVHMLIWYMYIL